MTPAPIKLDLPDADADQIEAEIAALPAPEYVADRDADALRPVRVYDFGVRDAKGRAVAVRIHTWTTAAGYLAWRPQVLRAGKPYGPITSAGGSHATAAERATAIERYLKSARARALKAHG